MYETRLVHFISISHKMSTETTQAPNPLPQEVELSAPHVPETQEAEAPDTVKKSRKSKHTGPVRTSARLQSKPVTSSVAAEDKVKVAPPPKKKRKANSRAEKKDNSAVEKLALKVEAINCKGRPSMTAATLKVPKKLTPEQCLVKYRLRLSLLPASDFDVLKDKYISFYHPAFKNYLESAVVPDSLFLDGWSQVLKEVAASKGVNVKGCLPHNHKNMLGSQLKVYNVRPECVLQSQEDEYKKNEWTDVKGERVYLGGPCASESIAPPLPIRFTPDDAKADELWYAYLISREKDNHSKVEQVTEVV